MCLYTCTGSRMEVQCAQRCCFYSFDLEIIATRWIFSFLWTIRCQLEIVLPVSFKSDIFCSPINFNADVFSMGLFCLPHQNLAGLR